MRSNLVFHRARIGGLDFEAWLSADGPALVDGTTISEGAFEHVYRIEGGLIVRMDIRQVLPC